MAGDWASTIAAIDELMTIEGALSAALDRHEGDWKRDYVRSRKALQLHISRMGELPREWAGVGEEQLRDYRDVYNRFRTVAALHQSTWPVVMIDHEDPAYKNSVSDVRAASAALVQALKNIMTSHL